MKMQRILSDKVKEPKPGTWSNCKRVGDQFFVSGMTAHDLAGNVMGEKDMYSQTKRTFEKIQGMVEAAGGKMNDIAKLTIFVTDITEREEVWKARAEFFTGDFPCCSLIGIKELATPELKVEIEAVGFIGAGAD
ncbi:RidA family protein [Pacificispira sp.]|uniref:RidA family protein n=1 Tax=Pacificispira sp. TaxID=2888761 RepID=UPI003BA9C6B6